MYAPEFGSMDRTKKLWRPYLPPLSKQSLTVSVLLIFFVSAALAFFSQKFEPNWGFTKRIQSTASSTSNLNYTPQTWPDEGFWLRLTGAPRDVKSRSRCSYNFTGCSLSNDNENLVSDLLHPNDDTSSEACPLYFRYIYEDLEPWSQEPIEEVDDENDKVDNTSTKSASDGSNGTISSGDDSDKKDVVDDGIQKIIGNDSSDTIIRGGVSRDMLERARSLASFRVVIKNGKLYVDAYEPCFQTRSIFTIWGLLQLLHLYPGRVPDVDLLFGCGDTPRVPIDKSDQEQNTSTDRHKNAEPPIFRYCSTLQHLDIPFPDWSFWGWPEVDLHSWDSELCGILKGQNELLWQQRIPTAFWKGNTGTGGQLRRSLGQCNSPFYGAEIIHQDWGQATRNNYKNSRLADQCKNRYKIYVEGWGWSVSLKYIFACDSPVLVVDPVFHDFFSRGLIPLEHYLPIGRGSLCDSIKFAVEWGNNSTIKADKLGRSGRQFIVKEVSMKHVYDYMLHILIEYAQLLRFEPTPTAGMIPMCREAFLCQAPEKERELYEQSMVKQASSSPPCSMATRDQKLIRRIQQDKFNIIRQAEKDPTSVYESIK